MNATRDRARIVRPRDPALDAMAAAWMGLRSPMHRDPLDQRFEQWLADAERQPELLADLAPRMLDSVADWLAEYERKSSVATSDDERCLAQFDEWASLVVRYRPVAAVLADMLDKWRRLRAQRLLAMHMRDVEAAIDRGDVTAAARELSAIEQLPDAADADLTPFRDAIDSLARREAEIESWRKAAISQPRDWQEVARIHEIWVKGRRLAETRGTPRDWAERIGRELEHLQWLAIGFVSGRAAECHSLDAIRAELAAKPRAIDEGWLEPLFAAMLRALDRAVEAADRPAALRHIVAGTAGIALPAPVREALHRIEAIAAAWDALQSNHLPAVAFDGALPARFADRLEVARRLAERVAAIEKTVNAGPAACRDAIAALEEILADAPEHPGARALLKTATARLELLLLDDAIERWDVDVLRRAGPQEPLYAGVLQAAPVLEQLAELRRPSFAEADLDAVTEWWTSWREVEARLPAQKPEALRRALDAVRRDAGAAVHSLVSHHCGRTTTIDEDRVAEAAVAELVVDLGLKDELLTLTARRSIHAAVLAARKHGTSRLAALLCDEWGTIERYLPWAASVVAEAFERAWEESNDDALEALRDVPFHNERFRYWLEWLDIERSLPAALTPDHARRLHEYVGRGASDSPLVRRLGRLIEKMRGNGDDAALTWAYRVFARLDPPLFPGVDPLRALVRRTEVDMASIVRACREAAAVDEAFFDRQRREWNQIEDAWARLEQLLLAVPPAQSDAWPAPPAVVNETRLLLDAFQRVLDRIAAWTRSDLRPLGEECDGVRRLLIRDLTGYPAAQSFDRVLRRVEPLTRMDALQHYFREACTRCGSDATPDLETRELFAQAARRLDVVIDTLRAAEPEGAYTMQVVADEYWREIPARAGDLLPPEAAGGLAALRGRLFALHDNELLFRDAIESLWRQQPNIGGSGEFDAAAHRDYLAHYPRVAPASLRVRRLFDDFAARAAQRVILRRSRELLPEWLQRYVDNISRGVSSW